MNVRYRSGEKERSEEVKTVKGKIGILLSFGFGISSSGHEELELRTK